MEQCAYGQGAKIHRKQVHLTVHPSLLVQEPYFAVTVHRFDHQTPLRISLYHGAKELISRHSIMCAGPLCTQILSIPETAEGKVLVILEQEKGGYWAPLAEESVLVLPRFHERIATAMRRAEAVEAEAQKHKDPLLRQTAWAVLAYAEDLLERVKFGDVRSSFILHQKLVSLENKVKKIEAGKDPYADVRGYQLRGYRSDLNGEIQLYSLYVPKQYEPGKRWPLAVMLHGAWSNHHLAMRRVMGKSNAPGENDANAKRTMPSLPDVPYFVVCPNGFETMSYEGFAEEDVWRVMREVEAAFPIDPDRVYMTGLSMGGSGTAKLAFRHPDRFAAIATVCGFFDPLITNPDFFKKPRFARRLEDMAAPYPLSDNILHVPIKLCHGDADPIVPVETSEKLHNRISKIGYHSELEIYPGVEHNAWDYAYKDARIFEWFSQFTRVKEPRTIAFKCMDSHGAGAYWLHIDELKEIRRFGTVKIHAEADGVQVESKNVQRLTLTVPSHFYPHGALVPICINKQEVFRGVLDGSPLAFAADGQAWAATNQPYQPRLLPGKSGLYSVFDDRQIFVHEDSRDERIAAEARKLAVQRSVSWAWADVRWDVLPESKLTPAHHADYNVILFATTQSPFLQTFAGALPFQMAEGGITFADRWIEPDQALTLIYPNPANPSRYILLNIACTLEGLKGLRPFSIQRRSLLLECEGDFGIWSKEGKMLWGGLFDKHWQVETKTVEEYQSNEPQRDDHDDAT
ncbi:MAG: prolyl oligopeptidase family serine peptidase [bacterium]|jgi:pimeloyl-ACP methyl ester carboxylesterase|nr:prolyl oligopeptidase family serine peptidase [bacterium]